MKKWITLAVCLCALAACAVAHAGQDEWICIDCGARNSDNFCENCGAARGSWTCPVCGAVNDDNFCPECGQPRPDPGVPGATVGTGESADALCARGEALLEQGDYEGAKECFESAAQQGSADAECNLGDMYYNGLGVERDLETALDYYDRAAGHGSAAAQYMMGALIEGRSDDDEDLERVIEYYRQSAEQGYAPAQYRLGTMYEHGEGVEESTEEAIRLYRQSAEQGYEDASERLKALGQADGNATNADGGNGEATDGLPPSFIPSRMVPCFNESLQYLIDEVIVSSWSKEEAAEVVQYMTLSYTETLDGVAYYNNADWKMEAAAYYYDRDVDLDAPADAISVTIMEEAGEDARFVTQMTMAYLTRLLDESVDYQSLLDFIEHAEDEREEFALNGYTFVFMHQDQRYQYALTANT